MPYSCSTAPAGTPATSSRRQTTSRCSACRPTHRSSTRSKTSGSICARTTSPCASTTPTTPSSMPAATPGQTSSRLPQDSPPSPAADGLPCHELRRLVLVEAPGIGRVVKRQFGFVGIYPDAMAEPAGKLVNPRRLDREADQFDQFDGALVACIDDALEPPIVRQHLGKDH